MAYFTFFGIYLIVVPFIVPKINKSLDLLAQDAPIASKNETKPK